MVLVERYTQWHILMLKWSIWFIFISGEYFLPVSDVHHILSPGVPMVGLAQGRESSFLLDDFSWDIHQLFSGAHSVKGGTEIFINLSSGNSVLEKEEILCKIQVNAEEDELFYIKLCQMS